LLRVQGAQTQWTKIRRSLQTRRPEACRHLQKWLETSESVHMTFSGADGVDAHQSHAKWRPEIFLLRACSSLTSLGTPRGVGTRKRLIERKPLDVTPSSFRELLGRLPIGFAGGAVSPARDGTLESPRDRDVEASRGLPGVERRYRTVRVHFLYSVYAKEHARHSYTTSETSSDSVVRDCRRDV
jgi:hypothetical protein